MKVSIFKFVFSKVYQFLRIVFSRKMIGAHAVVVNEKGEILLVRHTYTKGWYFPGGGVSKGEDIQEALERELREEVGVTLTEGPTFVHVGHKKFFFGDDYPMFFLVRRFQKEEVKSPEIAEACWFQLSDLPNDRSKFVTLCVNKIFNNH